MADGKVWRGIELAEGWKGSFTEFKKQFSHLHPFQAVDKSERNDALKEAYEYLVKGKDPQENGELPAGDSNGEGTNANESGE